MVYRWFVDRGCHVRYRPSVGGEIGQIGAHRSDVDRRLAWLLAQVRPVVQTCLEHVDRELLEDILFGPSSHELVRHADGELGPMVHPSLNTLPPE